MDYLVPKIFPQEACSLACDAPPRLSQGSCSPHQTAIQPSLRMAGIQLSYRYASRSTDRYKTHGIYSHKVLRHTPKDLLNLQNHPLAWFTLKLKASCAYIHVWQATWPCMQHACTLDMGQWAVECLICTTPGHSSDRTQGGWYNGVCEILWRRGEAAMQATAWLHRHINALAPHCHQGTG